MFKRDSALEALRDNVVEVCLKNQRIMRVTLREDLLPPSYKNEIAEEQKFHTENKELVACWNVVQPRWETFNIEEVTYLQVVDSY